MSKKFLIVLLHVIFLHVTLFGSILDDAIKEYKANNYKKSFMILNKYKSHHFNNETYNYYLCKSAYMVKNYKVSLSSCERILLNNPNNQYARYGLALAEYKLHMYEDAKNELTFLKKSKKLDTKLRGYVKFQLNKVNAALRGNSINVTVGVGLGYNTNANQLSNDRVINIPALNADMNIGKSKDDIYHQQLVSFSYSKMLDRTDLSLINSLFFTNEGYFDQKKQNMMYIGYQPSLSYTQDNYKFDVNVGLGHIIRDGKGYMNLASLNPRLSYKLTPALKLEAGGVAIVKRHLNEYKDYDSSVYEGSAALRYYRPKSAWKLGATFGVEKKRNDVRNDVSHSYYDGALEVYVPIYKKLALSLKNKYQRKVYKDTNVFFLNKRKDDMISARLDFMYSFADAWFLKAYYNYKDNNSNQDLYDFKQHLVGFNLYRTFDF